jgi:nucleoside-diphosphate-sugar epimerase
MTILVTGGSGFVGRALVRHLALQGHRLRLPLRKPPPLEGLPEGVEPVITPSIETIDPGRWESLLEGVEAVVHLAAIAHIGPAIPDERYTAVNRDASARLAEAAAKAGVRRFVFLSSIRAQVGPSSQEVQTEATPPAPTEAYGQSKLEAERLISAALPEAVHLRPALVVGGKAKGNLETMLKVADTPWPLPFASFGAPQAMIARENLVAAIAMALGDPAMRGETYVAADDPHPTLAQMLGWMRAGLGRPRRLLPLPEALLRWPLAVAGKAAAFERLAGGLQIDSAKLRSAGWRPPQPPEACFTELGRAARARNQALKQG